MANKTIPDLTAAASVALTDLFEVAQPDSKKATGTQIQASFTGKQDALGFTPENVANKSIDGTFAANSDTLYPSQKATKTYVDAVAGGVPSSRTIATTGPLAGGGDLSANRTFSIADAAADGATKGAAAFTAADFNAAAGVISIDYTNGQAASAVNKGFLTSADWTTFNSKASTEAPFVDTTAIVKGSADATKLLRFEVDGFTTATTRIATPPNQNFTMAGIDVSQTFSVTQTFTPAANSRAVNIAAAGLTGASSLEFLRVAGTWNTSGTPAALLVDITDAASNAASKLADFQISSASVFSIGKTGLLGFADGVRQIFNPNGTNSGINVGAHTADPSAPVNGDLWYESTANELHARINGATVALGAGGGSAPFIDSTAIIKGSADATKLLRIEVDGFTTGTTRVATPPNQDFIIAGTDVLQVFSVTQVFTPAVDTSAIQITGSSITGLAVAPFLDISGTWNTTETQRAVLINITDTASDANSSLLRCELGGSFRMNVDKVGGIQLAGGVSALGGITSTFSLAGSSATPFIDLTGTWNTSGTPTAIRLNVTDTASNAASKLLDLQIGAATKFAVDKTGSITFADGIRQIFNPNGTNAGINVGAHTADPSSLTNGDLWYQSTANELRARINGATVALGAGGGTSPPFDDGTAIIKGSADATKLFRIEVDGFTTATTRVATPPNQDFTMAGLEVQQTFTKQQTITPAVNTSGLVVSGFSLTGSGDAPLLDLSGTWNTSEAAVGIRLNITDTASNNPSYLMSLNVGGSPKFYITTTGAFSMSDGLFQVSDTGGFTASDESTMGGAKIINLGTPTNAADAATKAYVDGLAGGGLSGTGSPEGSVTAVVGVSYLDITSTDNPSLWYKAVGTGNTGWRQLIA